MTRRLVLLTVLLVGRAAAAQPTADAPPAAASSEDRCKAALDARGAAPVAPHCAALAVDVATAMLHASRANAGSSARLGATIAAAARQPRITDTPGAQASAGQTAAVASGEPVATAGGSVAAVGDTGQGLQLVTALAINPASIVLGETSKQSVWASRLADISIVLPLDVDSGGGGKGFRYIGGRFRLNTLAALQSAELERAVAAYQTLQPLLQALLPAITTRLESASDPGKCAAAIEDASDAAQATFCNGTVNSAALLTVATAARAALAQYREDVDRKYLSIEARFDRGDLNADMAKKDALLAGYLAAGYGLHPTADGSTLELRARAGAVYFHDGASDTSRTALYGAFGIELAVVRDLKRYSLSGALELTRQRGDGVMPPAAVAGNALRFGAAIPLDDGKVISVGVTVPLDGGESTIALSGDWSLLFGK
ncbi:MAG TPA: hypothetical protein VGD37_31185 [Kofleriaceae bacterium]|jgi:hypothetical protein